MGKIKFDKCSLNYTSSFKEASYFYIESDGKDTDDGVYTHMSIKDDLFELYTKKTFSKNENSYPIYAQILDIEAIELHKLTNIVAAHGGVTHYVNTGP